MSDIETAIERLVLKRIKEEVDKRLGDFSSLQNRLATHESAVYWMQHKFESQERVYSMWKRDLQQFEKRLLALEFSCFGKVESSVLESENNE